MTFRGDRCRIDGEHDRSQREGAPLLVPLGVRDHQPADLATSVAEGVDRIADRLERTLRVRRVDVVALTRAAGPFR